MAGRPKSARILSPPVMAGPMSPRVPTKRACSVFVWTPPATGAFRTRAWGRPTAPSGGPPSPWGRRHRPAGRRPRRIRSSSLPPPLRRRNGGGRLLLRIRRGLRPAGRWRRPQGDGGPPEGAVGRPHARVLKAPVAGGVQTKTEQALFVGTRGDIGPAITEIARAVAMGR